jgi:hypothetical protein
VFPLRVREECLSLWVSEALRTVIVRAMKWKHRNFPFVILRGAKWKRRIPRCCLPFVVGVLLLLYKKLYTLYIGVWLFVFYRRRQRQIGKRQRHFKYPALRAPLFNKRGITTTAKALLVSGLPRGYKEPLAMTAKTTTNGK